LFFYPYALKMASFNEVRHGPHTQPELSGFQPPHGN
jgi:hypothetical protein